MKPFIVSTAESRFCTQAMSNASRSRSSPVSYQRISALERRRERSAAHTAAASRGATTIVADLVVVEPADAVDLLDDRAVRFTTRELSG